MSENLSFNNYMKQAPIAAFTLMLIFVGLIGIYGGLRGSETDMLGGFLFLVIGLVVLALVRFESISLDKKTRRITVVSRTIFSKTLRVIDFSDVESVQFRWEYTDRGPSTERLGVLVLNRSDGSESAFRGVLDSSFGFIDEFETNSKKVADFLCVPFKAPTIAETNKEDLNMFFLGGRRPISQPKNRGK
ncbi:MAG: hypothetical protein WC861_04740 [Candidatus Micrarchaeia archaeon]|jgi:hypothetical protein